jgi:hypothetical protein
MTTDNFCFSLQNRLIQTSQTGGQRYSDTSPFSIPWLNVSSMKKSECNKDITKKRFLNKVKLVPRLLVKSHLANCHLPKRHVAKLHLEKRHLAERNRPAHIRHQCRKTTVLSCYRCLINTVVEKMNYT